MGLSNRFVLRATTTNGPLSDKVGKDGYRLGQGLTGWVLKHNRALRLNNIHDPKELGQYEGLKHAEHLAEYDRAKSFLACPISIEDSVLGVVRVAQASHGDSFTKTDESNLAYFSSNLAVLVQYYNLYEDRVRELQRSQDDLSVITKNILGNMDRIRNLVPNLYGSREVAGETRRLGPMIVDIPEKDFRRVFIGMPFRPDYFNMLQFALKPAIEEEAGLKVSIASERREEPSSVLVHRELEL